MRTKQRMMMSKQQRMMIVTMMDEEQAVDDDQQEMHNLRDKQNHRKDKDINCISNDLIRQQCSNFQYINMASER